jgi:hypothetical protein
MLLATILSSQDKYPPTNYLFSSDVHLCSGTKFRSLRKNPFSESQLGSKACQGELDVKVTCRASGFQWSDYCLRHSCYLPSDFCLIVRCPLTSLQCTATNLLMYHVCSK